MFKRNKAKREREEHLSKLRSHFSKMDKGKRLLLIDGRIGIFKGYNGDVFEGETFLFEENGEVQEVQLDLYDSLLVHNPEHKCLLCSGERIMEGLLRSPDGLFPSFRENITSDIGSMQTFNSRKISLHACRDCGYIMPFVEV
ncbi:hypothetical protein ACIQZG_22125 [Lysinibacillus sp. NPDC096418]|uniref:hypothetical protein n=1 Tax=Lysinibacillus sp. NPDC096418 TaxID=3364138 RepID=UPI0037F3C930